MQRIGILRKNERHEAGGRRHDRVAQTPRHLEARSIAAALWKRLPAGRYDDDGRPNISARGHDAELGCVARDVENSMVCQEPGADLVGLTEQRVEDVAGAVAVGKELAIGFFMQPNADLAE